MNIKNERKNYVLSIIHDRSKQVSSKLLGTNRDSKSYFGKKIYGLDDGVELLKDGVLSGKPYLVGRFGTTECTTWVRYEKMRLFNYKNYGECTHNICKYSGFFPDEAILVDKYCEYVFYLLDEIDLLCTMNTVGESYIVNNYCTNAQLTLLPVVDPCVTGWTEILKGKKVLVIHPMADTIEHQFKTKREEIFVGSKILPDFELKTIKAIQTIAGNTDERFKDWFDALEYMFDQSMKNEFDIALIGCGAYGLPLAAKIKKEGKTAIHMGGCLQLLFGIFGSRWTNDPFVQKYYNSSWVKPSQNETPNNSESVENGCYW